MKIQFYGECATPPDVLEANARHVRGLGLPRPSRPSLLAVVSGGPSIRRRVESIRHFPGDIWACSSAFPWCYQNDIHATYFNIDASPRCEPEIQGVTRAIVSSFTAPVVVEAMLRHGADVSVFELDENPHRGTTASAAPYLALEMGYTEIHLFGCESSFGTTTHAYRDEPRAHQMLVQCGSHQYLTAPDYFMQAEYLSAIVKACPSVFHEHSGGLLRGMIDHDYDIIAGTPEFAKHIGLAA